MPVQTRAEDVLEQPLSGTGKYSFVPNQAEANEWYHLNGYMEDSFGHEQLWPQLRAILQANNSALGIYAADIGHMKSSTLRTFRAQGLAVTTEMPGPTQCMSGKDIADVELFGSTYQGRDIFQTNFKLTDKDGRTMPEGKGWFVTRDGDAYAPDEIVLDHHWDSILPTFYMSALWAPGSESWEERKAKARRDKCPPASTWGAGPTRLDNAVQDYADYHKELQRRYQSATPAFSFWWPANGNVEWMDDLCMDGVAARHPDPSALQHALQYLTEPCHRDSGLLAKIVGAVCAQSGCPKTVYMDIDLTYNAAYTLDVLRRNKAILEVSGVSFGIGLVDECGERLRCVQTSVSKEQMVLKNDDTPGMPENLRTQSSLINKLAFLIDAGIIDGNTPIRIQSWSSRPFETGDQVHEDVSGSFANTTLRIFRETLIPLGWAVSFK